MGKKVKGEVRLERFEVPYRVYGDGDSAVICVSGAQQTMAAWRPFASRFSERHAVVLFDLPGLGRSRILRGNSFVSIDEQVRLLHEIIDVAVGGRDRFLCAASWGTVVASAYAATHPPEVHKMVLGSFGMKPNEALLDIVRVGRSLFEDYKVEQAAGLILERFGQRIGGRLRESIVRQFRELGRDQARSLYDHLGFVGRSGSVEEFIDLRAIRAHTLIVNGAEDPIIDPQDAHRAAALIPNAEAVVVKDAGHFLHLERPELMEVYATFLEEGSATRPVPALRPLPEPQPAAA